MRHRSSTPQSHPAVLPHLRRFQTPGMAQSGGCPQEALGTGRDTAADCGLRLIHRIEDLAWPGTQKQEMTNTVHKGHCYCWVFLFFFGGGGGFVLFVFVGVFWGGGGRGEVTNTVHKGHICSCWDFFFFFFFFLVDQHGAQRTLIVIAVCWLLIVPAICQCISGNDLP